MIEINNLENELKNAKFKIAEYEKQLKEIKKENKKLSFFNSECNKIFFRTHIALWLSDFTQLIKYINKLKDKNINDFNKFFDENPKELIYCIKLLKIKNINDTALNIFNAHSQEELQNNLNMIFTKNSFEIFKKVFQNIAAGNFQYHAESINKTLDGNIIFLEFAITIIHNDGLYDGLISLKDITQRKLAELELKKLQQAVQYAPISIVITDKNGIIEYVNPKAEQLTGYSKEELIGENPRIFKSGKTSRESYNKLWKTILAGNVWEGELFNRKKNGEFFWEKAIISPIYCSDDRISHFVAIKEDITQSKMRKEKLIKLTKELTRSEKELQKETIKLKKLNKKLIESEIKLKRTIEIKDKFFSIIAHDIRNPLQVIISSAELAEIFSTHSEYDNLHKMLERLVKTAFNLNDFVENLLSWGRIQNDNIQFKPEEIDFNLLLADFKVLVTESAKKKDIDLIFNNNLNDKIFADKNLLKAILTNLIFNAIKFTPNNGKIIVEAKEIDNYFQFSVSDTGVGISEENQKKLFQVVPDFKTEGTNQEKGSGLGLLLTKEFVEKHGGNIKVDSILGKGSTFTFTIPKK